MDLNEVAEGSSLALLATCGTGENCSSKEPSIRVFAHLNGRTCHGRCKNLLKGNESVVRLELKGTTGKRVSQLLPLSERIVRRCKV